MSIKNYTSKMSVNQIVAKIEKCLVENGAINILKEYLKDGTLDGLSFHIHLEDGIIMPFKLPAKIEEAFHYMVSLRKNRLTSCQKDKLWEQSQRIAWKLICDWVEIQMAMITLGQAKFAQAFLPYAYNPVKRMTFYEIASGNGFNLLDMPKDEKND